MSLIKIFVVWTPESALNLIIFLLISGCKKQLKLNKLENLIKFISVIGCMVLSSVFILPKTYSNIVINYIVHIFIYTFIFTLFYRIELPKTFICVLLVFFTLSTFENLYYPFMVSYISGGIENYNNNILQYILFSCVTRLAQLSVIIFLWKKQYILFISQISKKIYKIYTISVSIFLVCELCVSFMYVTYFNQMPIGLQITYGLALVALIVFFYVITYMIIHSTLKGVIAKGYKQYQTIERGAEESFKSIYSLLDNNEIELAKNYISLLIRSEENK